MRKEGLISIGSVLLAFLASQHHSLHMLLLAIGTGGAGMTFMTAFPAVRRIMLLVSLVMAGVTLYRARGEHCPRAMRVLSGVSGALTLGLVAWSLWQFGL